VNFHVCNFTDIYRFIRILIKIIKERTNNINLYEHYRLLVSDIDCETRDEAEGTSDKLKIAIRHD
jgi:hypothetical protein